MIFSTLLRSISLLRKTNLKNENGEKPESVNISLMPSRQVISNLLVSLINRYKCNRNLDANMARPVKYTTEIICTTERLEFSVCLAFEAVVEMVSRSTL
jgi:hypothetical protein